MGSEHLPGTESPPGKQKTTWRRPGIPRIGAPACVLGGRPDLWAGTERCHTSDRMFTSPSSPGWQRGRPTPGSGPGTGASEQRVQGGEAARRASEEEGSSMQLQAPTPVASPPGPALCPPSDPSPPSVRPQIQPAGPEVGSAVRTKRGGPVTWFLRRHLLGCAHSLVGHRDQGTHGGQEWVGAVASVTAHAQTLNPHEGLSRSET